MSSAWRVHKFGGTSLADADRDRRVASILQSEPGAQKAVVVSAMHKVTDVLQKRHAQTASALLSAAEVAPFMKLLNSNCHDLREILRAGPEVTAGGVFADLLRLASYLGGSAS